eukprot:gene9282-16430_t
MPILHKYNFSELLNRVARLVELEAAWAKGDKKLKHTFREWLWLLDEIQLVELHSGFRKLIKGLPRSRLYEIGHEVSAAAEARKRITAVGMVMKEFDPFRLELSYMTSISASGNTIYYKDSQLIRCRSFKEGMGVMMLILVLLFMFWAIRGTVKVQFY